MANRTEAPQISEGTLRPLLEMDTIDKGRKIHFKNNQKKVHWQLTTYIVDGIDNEKQVLLVHDLGDVQHRIPFDELENYYVNVNHAESDRSGTPHCKFWLAKHPDEDRYLVGWYQIKVGDSRPIHFRSNAFVPEEIERRLNNLHDRYSKPKKLITKCLELIDPYSHKIIREAIEYLQKYPNKPETLTPSLNFQEA